MIRIFAAASAVVAVIIILAPEWLPAAERSVDAVRGKPNVILIMTDDQGYGDLACHGNPILKTPHLDALHADSIRLTDFHVTPACATTRAGLMTGRHAHRTGVWHVVMGRMLLPPEEVTMGEVFGGNGYRTAVFGKWHLGSNYPFRPMDQGFDESLVAAGGAVGHAPDAWLNDYFDDTYSHNGVPKACEGFCTDVWFDHAIGFIQENRDKNFFVYIPTNAPHAPYLAPEEDLALYETNPEVPNAAFYGMITNIDFNVGRLREELRRLDLEDDTILIFTTDNGTAAGVKYRKNAPLLGFDAGMRGKKASPYEGGHRVPCFLRWPAGGLTGGRDIGWLTSHLDLLPTLIELCELDGQLPPAPPRDGISLAPLFEGEEGADWPDRTVVTELQREVERPVKWKGTAVMTERWRLVGGDELYDIQADPAQKTNVAGQHPEILAELLGEYDRWWDSVSERDDRVPEIVLGSDEANPTTLSCYHWNNETGEQRDMPWGQYHIVAGPLQNGIWNVRVERDGRYRFRLRRWPEESGLAINESAPADADPPEKPWHPLEPGNLAATSARLKIQGVDETVPVSADAEEATFAVGLRRGSTKLQTWFMDEAGRSRGAYYVEVQREGSGDL